MKESLLNIKKIKGIIFSEIIHLAKMNKGKWVMRTLELRQTMVLNMGVTMGWNTRGDNGTEYGCDNGTEYGG